MSVVYSSCRILIGLAILYMTQLSFGEAQLCDGYEVSGHCYKLFRVSTNWLNATQHCTNERRGRLASIYTSQQQQQIEQYLKAENIDVNDVWTSGERPDSTIFWGNPESFWRWVGDCDAECSKTGCDGGRLDVAFVIDASGSMASGDGWSLTKNFFQSLLATLDVGDDKVRISFIIYSSKEEMEETKIRKNLLDAGIENSKPELVNLLQDLRYLDGNTDTADVLELLRTSVFRMDRGDRIDAPNVAIILTDGQSTDTQLTKHQAVLTKDSGIQMFVVGVTPQVEISEIEAMSSEPKVEGQTYFLVKSYGDLGEAVQNVSRQLCYWNKMLNVVNNSAISPQGCYDNRNEDGLTEVATVIVSTPDVCILACKERGYLFAGVGYTPNVPEPVCRCGNEFGKGGAVSQCTIACQSTPYSNTNLCGGINRNFVYKTDGIYGKWIYDEPNNYNDFTKNNDGVQFCGAADSMDEDVFTFVDENCTNNYSFLCETDMGYCDGRLERDVGFKYFTLPTDNKSPPSSICVSMSVNINQRRTWHNARRYCQDHKGDLLRLFSFEQNKELTAEIKSNKLIKEDKYFWLGLYKENYFWMDGYVTEFKWTNFAKNEPRFERGDCIYIDPKSDFKWKVASCVEDKYFICDLAKDKPAVYPATSESMPTTEGGEAIITTTTAATTTTTTKTMTTTTTTTTTAEKSSTASTQNQQETENTTNFSLNHSTTRSPNNETFVTATNEGPAQMTSLPDNETTDSKTSGYTVEITSPVSNSDKTVTTRAPQTPKTPATTINGDSKTTGELILPTAGAAGSRTENNAFSAKKYWWLILLLCLFFLLLIILLIIFCCYKGGYTKVGPKIYDARPIADAPICTVLGDNEPYNFYVDSNSQVDLVVGSTIHGVPKKKCWNKTISSVSGYEDFYNIHDDGHVYDKIEID